MSEIRDSILKAFEKYGDDRRGSPTWWFRFDTPYQTSEIRKELKQMEREGLVTVPYRRRGQIQWRLVKESD